MDRKLLCLMKIGNHFDMNCFMENGTIFLRRLKKYREIEEPEIGDRHEGLSYSYQPTKIDVNVNGKKIEGIVGPVKIGEGGDNPLIYCMYGYNTSHMHCEPGKLLDERCYKFGDTAVLIRDGKKFFDRIIQACKKHQYGVKGELVSYVDYDSHHGEMGPLRKYKQWFEHQQEFRLVFSSKIESPTFKLNVGSIKDIAEMHPVKNMNALVKIESRA